jgi:predicted secreted hydrolase
VTAKGKLDVSTRLQSSAKLPDLSERPDAPVEWWFVQGAIDLEGDNLHFMAAFFQIHFAGNGSAPAQMLLVHVLDGRGSRSRTISRITPGIANAHKSIALEIIRSNFPYPFSRIAFRRHMLDTLRFAETGGIEIAAEPALVTTEPFSIRWRDFGLAQDGDDLHLSMQLGNTGDITELKMIPKCLWLVEDGAHLDPSLSPPYSYVCCPRLELRGMSNGEALSGQAWVDRQWGQFDRWFFTRKPGAMQLLGWDWIGLSLDNGHDILITQQHTPDLGRYGDGYAICFSDGIATRIDEGFSSEPLRHWTSRRSGAVYPVEKRLVFPRIELELDIAPLVDDQEIPVFGVPAIWQGAIAASGRMKDTVVRGSGRHELFGYGYAETLSRYISRQFRRNFSS